MNHAEQIVLYASNQLDRAQRAEFEKHLAECAACRADLVLWEAVAHAISAADSAVPAPARLAERALAQIQRPKPLVRALRGTGQLLRMQLLVIRHELWLSPAVLMALFLAMALLSKNVEVIYFFAPLLAAGTLSVTFGPEQDPASELTLATATSAWKILLARLTLVCAYNFLLAVLAGFVLLLVLPVPPLLGELLLGWLGPMACLSALALLLSLWIGTGNALFISYTLWAAQYTALMTLDPWLGRLSAWSDAYQRFWRDPAWMFPLALALLLAALWSAGRERGNRPWPAAA